MTDCHICSGQQTVESTLHLQLVAEQTASVPPFIALCQRHLSEVEGALQEIRKIQSPPVSVNVSAVTSGGRGGNR